MRFRSAPLLLLCVAFFSVEIASANEEFDFEKAEAILVVTESEVITYKDYPAFHQLRALIASAAKNSEQVISFEIPSLYSATVIGVGEHETVSIGSNWIAIGDRVAFLSDEESSWLADAVRARTGTGSSPHTLQQTISALLIEFSSSD